MGELLPNMDTMHMWSDGYESLAYYRARGGYQALQRALELSPAAIVSRLEEAGLRGRGGAAFPTALKWKSVMESDAPQRYLVVNGAEGEPGSFKDRTLMAMAPHAVLEGILIAAHTLQVDAVLFYVNAKFIDSLAALRQALAEAKEAGLYGTRGLVRTPVRIIPETHVYIAGEETALINVLMGNPAQPWHKPPYPTQQGYNKMPTVVNNVETLAHVAVILRKGAEWYRTERPALFAVSGDVRKPGVFELPLGTPLLRLLEEAGGPLPGQEIQAVLPGGYSTPWILSENFDVRLDYDSLREIGTGLGAAIIVVGSGRSLGSVAWDVLEFFARETCGKCPVCVRGTRAMADGFSAAREGALSAESAESLLALAQKHRRKGVCTFLDTAARFAEAAVPALTMAPVWDESRE
ncbi:putative NADH-quinone oxidoreductase subunit F 2 [Candidatus Hydrogenisulfobacillus filiaventi]|uniref:Putative NADH-quinone oxidoreductase subunit F 2 n=1 Tax=Candidatus Hydrogenisulfobacillus filiaventi TaxID=2707344 RepID=A0A6F8ZHC0_9FIRM|nr:SLBB domain-containing protein [Bacillota bacterium]CAB1129052.1 putative NADH-quinone oxidoreductase subunit F 2 [Candidatus Hydrogenisulfobacillus filiaventi]